ncbi:MULTISPECIES: hypothetical protein [Desulfosporosinus]|uniref:Uncharacterized protein n=1 Tax=Desulfosporosinus acididurans TaxID=476652 RepID=A0A0J1FJM9_9FIRM|nr:MULTISPECIES: hypothetical protein [Desulfosporosinus]KLU63674.1 hypothetical protein DEAC_c44130 [Desulfosporosinus acididurans]
MVLNNIKAFLLHLGLDVMVLFFFSPIMGKFFSSSTVVPRLFGLLSVVLCICLGLLLTPKGTKYKNFLSCILPAIIGLLVWLYCYVNWPDSFNSNDPSGWRLVYAYYTCDSNWMVGFLDNTGRLFYNANLAPLFSFIPSFLLFIGLELKARIIKR